MEYKLVHVGVNCKDEENANETANCLAMMFDLNPRTGEKSIFAGSYFECMKTPFRGKNGHIAMAAADLGGAIKELAAKGIHIDESTLAVDDAGRPKNVYLQGEFGGFAIHIMQAKN